MGGFYPFPNRLCSNCPYKFDTSVFLDLTLAKHMNLSIGNAFSKAIIKADFSHLQNLSLFWTKTRLIFGWCIA